MTITYLYHAETGEFFTEEGAGDRLPPLEELWPVTAEERQEQLDAQGRGMVIVPGENGEPVIAPPEPPSVEEQSALERGWRSRMLTATDGIVARDRDQVTAGGKRSLTSQQFSSLLQYRDDLRDWPSAEGFPDSEKRPVQPVWLTKLLEAWR